MKLDSTIVVAKKLPIQLFILFIAYSISGALLFTTLFVIDNIFGADLYAWFLQELQVEVVQFITLLIACPIYIVRRKWFRFSKKYSVYSVFFFAFVYYYFPFHYVFMNKYKELNSSRFVMTYKDIGYYRNNFLYIYDVKIKCQDGSSYESSKALIEPLRIREYITYDYLILNWEVGDTNPYIKLDDFTYIDERKNKTKLNNNTFIKHEGFMINACNRHDYILKRINQNKGSLAQRKVKMQQI